ncbi:MAG: hypothetical protein VW338_03465 [Rhodospirillaceae bacterium]
MKRITSLFAAVGVFLAAIFRRPLIAWNETLSGTATVFGADGTVTWTGVTATVKPVGTNYIDEHDIAELRDGDNDVIALAATNPRKTVEIELIITGALLATAKAVALPTILASVTLSSMKVDAYNGSYNYVGGGRISTTPEGFARVSIIARQYGGAAFTTPS